MHENFPIESAKNRLKWWKRQANFVPMLLVIIGFSACSNPFETRTPTPPNEDPFTWEQPVSPQIVLTNLKHAYEGRHLENYQQCLDTTFIFEADPFERDGPLGNLYTNWTFEVEQDVTQAIFEAIEAGGISLFFSRLPDRDDDISGRTAILYRMYALELTPPQPNPPFETSAQGIAIFTLIEDDAGFWKIQYWQDQRTNTVDWGAVKGSFR